jgi:osmoprotectant transport system permease protein
VSVGWLAFVGERAPELGRRLGEHVLLAGGATLAAAVLAVPLTLLAVERRWLRGPVVAVASALQTVPSLAMLAALLALTGELGVRPALIALTLYGLLPIIHAGLAGLDAVPPAVLEAARALGMSPRRVLLEVRLPLALPGLAAGVRTAAVTGVGVATLAAFVGAGGLGQFIVRGLSLSDPRLVLLGALPAAALALAVDGALAAAVWGLRPRSRKGARARPRLAACALAAPVVMLVAGGSLALAGPARAAGAVRVGSKDFAEQLLLGELMAQAIEARGLPVERRLNLGGTLVCHEALTRGELDVYAEYSGTALTAVLGRARPAGAAVQDVVRREYRDRFDLAWRAPFGFDNTYALAVREAEAAARGWRTISDLRASASSLRAAFTAEFAERPDGWPGLRAAYGLSFASVRDVEPSLLGRAVRDGAADVACVFATDGRLDSYGLVVLADDAGFFPPYEAAPVVRRAVLDAQPQVALALDALAGAIDDATMRSLNRAVEEGAAPRDVARAFLAERGLTPARR